MADNSRLVQIVAVRRVATDADGAKRTRPIVVSVPQADTVIQKAPS